MASFTCSCTVAGSGFIQAFTKTHGTKNMEINVATGKNILSIR